MEKTKLFPMLPLAFVLEDMTIFGTLVVFFFLGATRLDFGLFFDSRDIVPFFVGADDNVELNGILRWWYLVGDSVAVVFASSLRF